MIMEMQPINHLTKIMIAARILLGSTVKALLSYNVVK
jgi:hypothetical protein